MVQDLEPVTSKVQNSERGARLLEERNRLGLTQPQLAEVGGVSKGSQILYEKGSAPTADYLSAIAGFGADVAYILTGERSAPPVDRSMLGVPMADFVQVRAWPKGRHDALEEIGEFAFHSSWLRRYTTSPGECYLFRTYGNEMEPTIRAGAIVLIDQQRRDPRPDGVFALRREDGGLNLRRLEPVDGKIVVRADNPAYSLTLLSDRKRILGEVIWQSMAMVDPVEGHSTWR
ncbi:MAG: S24 family peptidase [Paracoccus aminovorans]|nr:S24 family peptidase [Paracoccus aminovorans]